MGVFCFIIVAVCINGAGSACRGIYVEFPRLWTILLGIFLIFITSMVFIVLAKRSGILSQSGKAFQKGDGKNYLGFLGMILVSFLERF